MLIRHLHQIPVTQNHHHSVFRQALLSVGEIKGEIQTFNYAYLNPSMSLEMHSHPDGTELYYILEGSGSFTVSNQTYPVSSQDLIIIYPAEPHSLAANSEKITFLTLRTVAS